MKYILFLLGICVCNVKAQQVGSTEVLIKLAMFQEAIHAKHDYYVSSFEEFNKVHLKVDLLKNTGFEEFSFYFVYPDFDIPESVDRNKVPTLNSNCKGYVLAIQNKTHDVYRLSGFYLNDFRALIASLKRTSYKFLNSRKDFSKYYSVEKLDLDCLYMSFENKGFNVLNYPCLHYCAEMLSTHGPATRY